MIKKKQLSYKRQYRGKAISDRKLFMQWATIRTREIAEDVDMWWKVVNA